MKTLVKFLIFSVLISLTVKANAQPGYINYYNQIKTYNLFEIWRGDGITVDGGNGQAYAFPEPIGFIGENYQRFYIHYTAIIKDTQNPYKYMVSGKTRVNNSICNFKGTITVIKASLSTKTDEFKHTPGELICLVDIKEDPAQKESGFIKGRMISKFYFDFQKQVNYNTINAPSAGFWNNEVTGTWTSYKTHETKKCNWGDFRIPQSGPLDNGEGEFRVNPKYVGHGWQNYPGLSSPDKEVKKKAVEEETRKWWRSPLTP